MRILILGMSAALALSAVPALAYENFIPLGQSYAPGDDDLPAIGTEKDQLNAQVDIYETENYVRDLAQKQTDSRVRRLMSDPEPGELDYNYLDY